VNIEGTYSFAAKRDEVWAAVQDPEVLSKILPGVQELKQTGENEYWARMKIRIGPVQGVFSGTVKLSDHEPPTRLHLSVEGKGAPGFVKGNGDLSFEEDGQSAILNYTGEAQVGGRIASVGQRLMESSTQALIGQSLEALDLIITARVQGAELDEIPEIEAPSDLAFAAGVTRKMLEDFVPVERRSEMIQGGVIVMLSLGIIWAVTNWWTNRLANRIADVIEERQNARM
jgi:carbon monoxide dehydrogenase subunit G